MPLNLNKEIALPDIKEIWYAEDKLPEESKIVGRL